MNVLAILAHDKSTSLNAHLFNIALEQLKSGGHNVDVLKLYDYQDKIPFFLHDTKAIESNNFFQENKQRILAADRLLIVHPVYWYSLPGILKSWVDLITNFAYKYEGGVTAKPLHKIKRAMVINTSMEPAWVRRFLTGNPATQQLKKTFKFIGIPSCRFYQIGAVMKLNETNVSKHATKIRTMTKWLAK